MQATIKDQKGDFILYEYSDQNCNDLVGTNSLHFGECYEYGDAGMKLDCNNGQASFVVFESNDCSGESSPETAPPAKTCTAEEFEGKTFSYRYEC